MTNEIKQLTPLLTEAEVAKVLGYSVHKLRRDRWAGGGIPYVKLNDHGAVRYQLEDVEAFIASRVRKNTAYAEQRKEA